MNCGETVPATFTNKGVSDDEIAEIETRLEIQLPTALKDFLAVTNGFYHDHTFDGDEFFPMHHICTETKGPTRSYSCAGKSSQTRLSMISSGSKLLKVYRPAVVSMMDDNCWSSPA